MILRSLSLTLLAALILSAPAAARERICGKDGLCRITVTHGGETRERTYRVRAPRGWDGVAPLPVVIHFHGWGRTSRFVVNNKRQTGPAERQGVLLVAPDSIGKTWSFRTSESRDVAMIDVLIADLAARAPIQREKVLITGFSHGGAMAWRVACDRGGAFAGYAPIAGYVGGLEQADCKNGPARVLQVHGTRDPVQRAPVGRRGDPSDDFMFWRTAGMCALRPTRAETVGRFQCRHWARCDAGAFAGLCLINAQHLNPKRWLDYAIPTLLNEAMLADLGQSVGDL